MTDHADTIRRQEQVISAHSETILRLTAERQQAVEDVKVYREEVRQVTVQLNQAIDERDAARKEARDYEVAANSMSYDLSDRARKLEQAIDALRSVAAASPAVNTCNCINIARAALLNLGGETE